MPSKIQPPDGRDAGRKLRHCKLDTRRSVLQGVRVSACRTALRIGFRPALLGLGALLLFHCTPSLAAAEPVTNDAPRQEPGLLARIMNPDRTLRFEPSRRSFSSNSASPVREKSARARTFALTRSTTISSYRTEPFGGASTYRTSAAGATDRSALTARRGSEGFGAQGTTFPTREIAPRTDPAAGQTFTTRSAATSGSAPRPFLVAGKRQGALDEQARARPMTIEEVRELLNKNR